METFIDLKDFAENRHFHTQRAGNLHRLSDEMIDDPIIDLVIGFNNLSYCFTLQCCYGHFVYDSQKDLHNLEPLSVKDTMTPVEYRIAYIAFCIENSASGRALFKDLSGVTTMDPANIQFCCAEWFWERQVNSYVLQVTPDRFKLQDRATVDYQEALSIEKVRNRFFVRLEELLRNKL